MHDVRGAALELQTTPGVESDSNLMALSGFVRGMIALERGAYSSARDEFRLLEEGGHMADVATTSTAPAPACYIAISEESTGNSARADTDIAAGGHYVDCYRFKGDLADHRGNWRQDKRTTRQRSLSLP